MTSLTLLCKIWAGGGGGGKRCLMGNVKVCDVRTNRVEAWLKLSCMVYGDAISLLWQLDGSKILIQWNLY